MRKLIIFMMALMLSAVLTGCGADENTSQAQPAESQTAADITDNAAVVVTAGKEAAVPDAKRVKLTINGQTAVIAMLNNDAAKDFISMLPMSVTFEDYNNIEKIAMPLRRLNLGNAPTSSDPDVGSFAYYEPCGNLSVFYRDFRESNRLIPLGTFEYGVENLEHLEGPVTMTLEVEENL